ncbi:ethanolamine ammonia-lyase subunit EutC [Methylovulum psychrotolerans]|uniref:Ethanolamine ammonia-lyase small subunit n=1 Tax=Methylovulum psychrotolerans TaxID=1704499 RepID=A0A1Z4BX79_9GAMM|nr:ethanolamine ammonia-lyase subunit EutC [Methylovulum psychrotolerans]ASF45859.1 ethanolamine ammonia-lyase [Methylovulum psychrotolerans]
MAVNKPEQPIAPPDPWQTLREFTPARIGLGRAGMSLPTQASLDFQLAHALARDAVNIPLDFTHLAEALAARGLASLTLASQADNQRLYLQRPDLGRLLAESAAETLRRHTTHQADAVIVVADGLSSKAIACHAENFLALLLPALQSYALPPVCLVRHGRVAIGDAIAEQFAARLCILLIGERPGLSSPDSMGIYFTYRPRAGISTDADRNCISNIHHNGLSYAQAVQKLLFLIKEAEQRQLSGVELKDGTVEAVLDNQQASGCFLLG